MSALHDIEQLLSQMSRGSNGTYVVYSYQKDAASLPRLESSTTQSGMRMTLYAPGASDPMLFGFDLSPDSQWVMYRTSSGGGQPGTYTLPPTGGNPTNHRAGEYKLIAPNSERIAYSRVVSSTIGTSELFSAQIFGGDERNLSGMNGVGYIGTVIASKDSMWIVYEVQIDGRLDLRVSDGLPAQVIPPTYKLHLPLVIR